MMARSTPHSWGIWAVRTAQDRIAAALERANTIASHRGVDVPIRDIALRLERERFDKNRIAAVRRAAQQSRFEARGLDEHGRALPGPDGLVPWYGERITVSERDRRISELRAEDIHLAAT